MDSIGKLPWGKEKDFLTDFSKSPWQRISPKTLERRIQDYPLTRELIEGILDDYIEEIILKKEGYCLLPSSVRTFTLFVQEYPKDIQDFEIGVIHELIHLIYRVQGNSIIGSKDNDLIESIIEKTARKFQEKNLGYISKKLDEIYR